MKYISFLCTDSSHPVNAWLEAWTSRQPQETQASISRKASELTGGDFLFLVSCQEIISKAVRAKYRHALVLHASALPKGRGMSPHVWEIIQGANHLCVTLLNAEDDVDSGAIWHQIEVQLDGTELHDQIHQKLFDAELALIDWAVEHCDDQVPRPQVGEPTFYRKRTPADSAIDPTRPLIDSFDQLRIADPDRYPAFFEFRGCKYRIRIDKL